MSAQEPALPPIACDLTAIPADQRESHMAQATLLLAHAAQAIRELPDGLAFQFSAADYPQVTAFIANERLCCPFFTFVLEVPPAPQPLWLRITGPEGVKEFLQTNLLGVPRIGDTLRPTTPNPTI